MGQISEALVAAIAQIWQELPGLVEGDWGEFQSAVLTGLAVLQDAELTAAAPGDDRKKEAALRAADLAQTEVLDLLRAHPSVNDLFRSQFQEAYKERRSVERYPAGGIIFNTQRPFFAIPVFYATDRSWAGGPEWYTGQRADSEDLSYGVIMVSLPTDRRIGTVPTQMSRSFGVRFSWINRSGFNPQKYCEIMSVDPEPPSGFAQKAGGFVRTGGGSAEAQAPRPGAARAHDVLVFIHGFNVGFAAAAKRAAQLAYDLDFTGVIVLYSWPSRGTVTGYVADGNSAEWSTPHLVHLLRDVLPGIGGRQIHVVAHSMGNQILVRALDRLGAATDQRLGHVVFVEPDVDAGVFGQLSDGFGEHAVSYTLYMSSKDLALRVSGIVGGHRRAGARDPDVTATIEIIDASRLPKTDALGHSGFAESRTMLNDLKDLLVYGRTADQRSGIEPRSDPVGHRYWMFPA